MNNRISATNIKVEFHGHTVKLLTEDDRRTTSEGVEIYIQKRPGNEIRPMAVIPDGTLDKYKHCRPKIISLDWKEL